MAFLAGLPPHSGGPSRGMQTEGAVQAESCIGFRNANRELCKGAVQASETLGAALPTARSSQRRPT